MSGITGSAVPEGEDEVPAVDAPKVPSVPAPAAPTSETVDCIHCKNTREVVHGGVIPCPYCTQEGIAKYGILTLDPTKLSPEEQRGYLDSRRALGI